MSRHRNFQYDMQLDNYEDDYYDDGFDEDENYDSEKKAPEESILSAPTIPKTASKKNKTYLQPHHVPIQESQSGTNVEYPKIDELYLSDAGVENSHASSGIGLGKSPQLSLLDSPKKTSVDTTPLEGNSEKQLLHMIVIGHVDAGKSTLMGHLLYKLGCVDHKTLQKYEHESKKIGKQSFAFAWMLDETGEERERGVTVDIGRSKFETDTKRILLLDAPGHKDFIPNMIAGATQADVAVLVIDSTEGEFETGFESGGQTKEHTLLVRSLGVNQVVVVINKMDNIIWSKDRFDSIKTKLNTFLIKQVGFKEADIQFIPCSGLSGENLTEPPKISSASWYTGPTLIKAIDLFRIPERLINKPLRLCVSDVCKGAGATPFITGRIEAGSISVGSKVLVQPYGDVAVVKGITIDQNNVQHASAGDLINITVSNNSIDNIGTGNVICDIINPIKTATRFEARIVVFDIKLPITRGHQLTFHLHSFIDTITIYELKSEIDRRSLEVKKKNPRFLKKDTVAIVSIIATRPICVELHSEVKEFSRFMLRDGGVSVAAGQITKIIR